MARREEVMSGRLIRLVPAVVGSVALATSGPLARPADDGPAYVQGPATAPVTIVVFSNLTCSACAKLHLETLAPLRDSLVSEGRVRVVHCLVPSPRDAVGMQAARCVHAARRMGRFEEVATALFSSQRTWMLSGNLEPTLARVLDREELKELHGLVASGVLEDELKADIEAGRRAGVRATPTMVVRHHDTQTPIVGAVSYGILTRYLERLLKDS
jgi:protein-disulfide isomerase